MRVKLKSEGQVKILQKCFFYEIFDIFFPNLKIWPTKKIANFKNNFGLRKKTFFQRIKK